MWEGLLGGDWPEGSTFAFEALSCPCVTCLSDVEGGGLLADGQTLMQLATWGSAMSTCMPFRCCRTSVVPIVGG
jgi:hypothetical protein